MFTELYCIMKCIVFKLVFLFFCIAFWIKMTSKGAFYVRERGTDAIYRFFKDETLRFYLYDVFGPNNVIRQGTTGTAYNPFIVYLINKV